MNKDGDKENPDLNTSGKDKFLRFDPAFPVTCLSALVTGSITHMVVYGLSGRGRLASICALATFPVSWGLSLYDAEQDYILWKKTKHLREKGVAEKFMPYRVKYDWTDYEDKMYINPERIRIDDEIPLPPNTT